jgi:hypothetical protein
MLYDIFIFFKILDFKKFLLLKIVDLITICRHRENYFRELNNFNCFDFLHLAQKFDLFVVSRSTDQAHVTEQRNSKL